MHRMSRQKSPASSFVWNQRCHVRNVCGFLHTSIIGSCITSTAALKTRISTISLARSLQKRGWARTTEFITTRNVYFCPLGQGRVPRRQVRRRGVGSHSQVAATRLLIPARSAITKGRKTLNCPSTPFPRRYVPSSECAEIDPVAGPARGIHLPRVHRERGFRVQRPGRLHPRTPGSSLSNT